MSDIFAYFTLSQLSEKRCLPSSQIKGEVENLYLQC